MRDGLWDWEHDDSYWLDEELSNEYCEMMDEAHEEYLAELADLRCSDGEEE